MRRKTIELAVGLGLLLGPLAYALTLEPEVVEVEVPQVIEIERATPVVELEAPVVEAPVVEPPVVEPPVVEPPAVEPPAESADDRLAFAFVNTAGLVLHTSAKLAWGEGHLRDHEGPGQFLAAKRASASAVPAELWVQRGRTFDLYGAEGKVCTARLGELSVLAQHDGPGLYDLFFDEYAYDEDDESAPSYDEFDEADYPPRAIRRQVWSTTDDDGAWLVAEVVSETSCAGALWARDAQLPPPVILHRSDAPNAAARHDVEQFEASDDLADLRTEYMRWHGELDEDEQSYEPDWATIAYENPTQALTWWTEQHDPALVELQFGLESGWCGDGFDTQVRSISQVSDGQLVPMERPPHPIAVFDADLDGRYEFLTSTRYDEEIDSIRSETLADSWGIPEVFVCPC